MDCLCLQRRRGPGEHGSVFVWPSQRGNMWGDHKCHIAYLQSAPWRGPCGSGLVIMCCLCREQDVNSSAAGTRNIFVHSSSPVSKQTSVLLNWVFMDVLDLLFRSCIQRKGKRKVSATTSWTFPDSAAAEALTLQYREQMLQWKPLSFSQYFGGTFLATSPVSLFL